MKFPSVKHKVKAAILPTVVTLSVLITIMVSAIILLAYYRSLLLSNHEIKERLLLNAESGINYVLGNSESIQGKVITDLYEQERDTVLLEKKAWGLYDVALCIASQGNHFEKRAALYGVAPDKYAKCALYLTDENRQRSRVLCQAADQRKK